MLNIGNLVGNTISVENKEMTVLRATKENEKIILELKEKSPGENIPIVPTSNLSKKRKICIIIGHGGNDCGAVSQDRKVTELGYNTDIANDLVELLEDNGYEAFTHNRGFARMENTTLINSLNPDLIISLHCNSANTIATGTEAIYYPDSKNGKRFAELLSKNVSESLGLKNRGAKEPWHGRGSGLLSRTKAPCIISEPYFIDNNNDLKVALEKKNEYMQAIVKSIDEYFA